MKKTLTINLGGIVFHIDEDAYLLLHQYLENLATYFKKQEGYRDILNDIESRIAEILTEKQSEAKQVITIDDVTGVMAIMGQPVEIDGEENAPGQNASGVDKGDKRFFRNPDEKVIAGVCSGIAAYFHLDPVWVRLIFLIFIAAGGSGILIYLVLWFVIPEAQTTSDKLEMRGKKINISNIEKTMRAEVSELSGRIGAMAGKSAETIKRSGAGAASFFEVIMKGIVEVLAFTGKVLVFLAGIILVLVGIALLLTLLAYTLGWTGGIYSDFDLTVLSFPALARFLVGCSMPVFYLQIIILIVLGIPLFMLLYSGMRMLFRFDRIRYLGLTMFNIWVVGVFFLAWSGVKIYNLYKFQEEKQIEIALEKPAADTLNITLMDDDPGLKYLRNEKYALVGDLKTIITEKKELYVVPKIRIEQSDDSIFSISQVTIARGKSRLEAHEHLTGLRFQSATSGSTLKISPFVRLPRGECWRGEIVDLVVRVPRGKFIHIDPSLRDLKPYWYYLLNSSDKSTFLMTENGLEVSPGTDYIKVKGDTTSIVTVRK
ncbi:MAG: PspC domain-containing protein [Bacteroidetes bacterium]|nr:PspC domain-containing protein [Bacteroidota bacterium]